MTAHLGNQPDGIMSLCFEFSLQLCKEHVGIRGKSFCRVYFGMSTHMLIKQEPFFFRGLFRELLTKQSKKHRIM